MSEWSVDTGLADDYDGTVLEAWFSSDSRYNNGQTLMMFWKIKLDRPELFPMIAEGETQERWPCGDGWESVDGGETAEHPGGSEKKFHANSQYGQLIKKAIKDMGIGDILDKRGTPQEAKVWAGLRFHFDRIEKDYKFKDRETGQEVSGTSNKLMPTAYLGTEEHPVAGSGPSSSLPAFNLEESGIDSALLDELKSLAAQCSTAGEFTGRALGLTGVPENDTVVGALSDERFFTTLKG